MLQRLPEELLARVVKHLDTASLKELALVKRGFLSRIWKGLYRDVTFTYERNVKGGRVPFEEFLQAVISFPERRKLVESLHFTGRPDYTPW